MKEVVIRGESLGKRYRIGERERYLALRDVLTRAFAAPFRRGRRGREKSELWALRNVSFEVRQGEVVGVIGRNGAGKSTLLKILARITKPTEGSAEIRGRIGSLLEVGTGFHPELTGRENVYLSGAILGMTRREIARKFDEIVAFSEVEKFIDTPLKHYSSGMQMRLAFAVAAHLEPEILLVDEVLAVGDLQFQKKCLGKMQDISGTGRTVIFVSHNVAAVTRLCATCILLDQGRLLQNGPTHEVLHTYLNSELATTASREWGIDAAPGNGVVCLRSVRARSAEGSVQEAFDIRRPICIEVVFDVLEGGCVLAPNIHLFNEEGVVVFVAIDNDTTWNRRPRPVGRYTCLSWIPGNFLAEGSFLVDVAVTTFVPFEVHFHEPNVIAFQVVDSIEGDSARGDYGGHLPGVVRPILEWETVFEPAENSAQHGVIGESKAMG